MDPRAEYIISDLSMAGPSESISATPAPGKWLVLPYEGEVSGKMLWCPARCRPPDVSIPLPDMGRCQVHIGLYGSGTVPIWYNLYGPKEGTKSWYRLHVRLSSEDWYDLMTPDDYPGEPRFTYISEAYWKTVDVSGKSIVFAPPRKEAYQDMMACVAYVRLVPAASAEVWPRESKRLIAYCDSNFCAHYVDGVPDIKSYIEPLRESDFHTVLWTACREDTCYYPTRVGNRFTDTGVLGVYPYWAGRDLERMLHRGEDPVAAVCAYYGMDIEAIARERLVDILIPSRGHYFPDELGERNCTEPFLAEFVKAAQGTGIRVCPAMDQRYADGATTISARAAAFYRAGADGLQVGTDAGLKSAWAVLRRLGHVPDLHQLEDIRSRVARRVGVRTVAGMRIDLQNGLPTCG